MKKVVQFVSVTSVYNIGLQKELLQCPEFTDRFENECINLEDTMRDYEKSLGIGDYSKLSMIRKLFYWIGMNRYLLSKYGYLKKSVVDIQYVSVFYVMLLPFISATFDRIVLSFWGSDLLRQGKLILFLLRMLIRRSSAITFPTSDMADSFREKFGNRYDDRIHVIRFGNYFLDDLDASGDDEVDVFVKKYGIDTSKTVVAVGYNRFCQHRHIEAINSFIENRISCDRVFIIVPWTYGPRDDEYKERVETVLKGNYEYAFLTERLSDPELVALRKITDIQVIVQTTDGLNATMLETMYAGGEVIIGSWLQYKDIYERGINMWKVDNVKDTGAVLARVLDSPMSEEKRKFNKELIRQLYSWKEVIKDWVALYG